MIKVFFVNLNQNKNEIVILTITYLMSELKKDKERLNKIFLGYTDMIYRLENFKKN